MNYFALYTKSGRLLDVLPTARRLARWKDADGFLIDHYIDTELQGEVTLDQVRQIAADEGIVIGGSDFCSACRRSYKWIESAAGLCYWCDQGIDEKAAVRELMKSVKLQGAQSRAERADLGLPAKSKPDAERNGLRLGGG